MTRNFDGILVVDKPTNMTSATLVAKVKKLFKAKKVGHTGTLDPFATGVLVCCINKATRLAEFLVKGSKTYEAVLYLGISTETQDNTGKILSINKIPTFSVDTLTEAFNRFKGVILQKPPVYSALKHKGVPLYKLARKGKPVQKPARQVEISSIKIMDIDLPEIRFEVSCSGGTYVRTLCADIGEYLGCGGHLKELRRIENSGFSIKKAVSVSELESATGLESISRKLIPMKDALKDMPEVLVPYEITEKIRNGALITKEELNIENMAGPEGFIKAIDKNDELVAVLKHVKNLDRLKYSCVLIS